MKAYYQEAVSDNLSVLINQLLCSFETKPMACLGGGSIAAYIIIKANLTLMRSIGFLGLGVDEKHGSLHATLVLQAKRKKCAGGWGKTNLKTVKSWKGGRCFWVSPLKQHPWNRDRKLGEVLFYIQLSQVCPLIGMSFYWLLLSTFVHFPFILSPSAKHTKSKFSLQSLVSMQPHYLWWYQHKTHFYTELWMLCGKYCLLLWSSELRHRNIWSLERGKWQCSHTEVQARCLDGMLQMSVPCQKKKGEILVHSRNWRSLPALDGKHGPESSSIFFLKY